MHLHGGWVTLFVFLLIVLVLHIAVKSEERKKKRDNAEIAFEEVDGIVYQIRISGKYS